MKAVNPEAVDWYRASSTMEDDDGYFFADTYDFNGVDPDSLTNGVHISRWNKDSYFRASEKYDGKFKTILEAVCVIPVFHRDLLSDMHATGIGRNDIQELPVKVFNSKGELIEGYSVINVITQLEALDREHSKGLVESEHEVDPSTGKKRIKILFHPALKSKVLIGHDIIRLQEWFSPIFVSSRFKRLFEKKKYTGYKFKKLVMV